MSKDQESNLARVNITANGNMPCVIAFLQENSSIWQTLDGEKPLPNETGTLRMKTSNQPFMIKGLLMLGAGVGFKHYVQPKKEETSD